MTAVATWVIRASLALAVIAAAVNLSASRRLRAPLFAAVGALSLLYVGGYVWLLAHPTERAAWSEVMSGVSLLAWPLVWIGPAFRSRVRQRQFEQALTTMADPAPKVPA